MLPLRTAYLTPHANTANVQQSQKDDMLGVFTHQRQYYYRSTSTVSHAQSIHVMYICVDCKVTHGSFECSTGRAEKALTTCQYSLAISGIMFTGTCSHQLYYICSYIYQLVYVVHAVTPYKYNNITCSVACYDYCSILGSS